MEGNKSSPILDEFQLWVLHTCSGNPIVETRLHRMWNVKFRGREGIPDYPEVVHDLIHAGLLKVPGSEGKEGEEPPRVSLVITPEGKNLVHQTEVAAAKAAIENRRREQEKENAEKEVGGATVQDEETAQEEAEETAQEEAEETNDPRQ